MQTLTPAEATIQHQLTLKIRDEIEKHSGIMCFSKFMEMALYTPELGYYCNPRPRFGRKGDFITAPELTPLFSICIAKQCREILSEIPNGNILEFGAGSGTLAAHTLQYLAQQNCLPASYQILELSAYLHEQQRETIWQICPELLDRVSWLSRLPEPGFEGVVIANEVLDAMPVKKILVRSDGIHRAGVRWNGSEFSWGELPCDFEIRPIFQALKPPYDTEFNPNLSGWLSSVNAFLTRGVVLIADYGFPQHEYYHPDRHMGTLMCHFHHRAHTDPLIFPGIQDITAHVDFTDVAQSAENLGLHTAGFTTQALFLLGMGVTEELNSSDEKIKFQQLQAIKQLTLSSEMGELFKVMALSKDFPNSLRGFQLRDLRDRLFSR